MFRYTIFGKRREMGIGSLSAVSLNAAREIASECRKLVARDIDPIERAPTNATARRKLPAKKLREIAQDA